ncbi:response regulator transcription factor [Promicromonospora alba]|uniref:Response regulator transcription factor n=1 Tax=Promicromonospora alba TaxID=1616110 RepID=A0ABV9HG92_9MICO
MGAAQDGESSSQVSVTDLSAPCCCSSRHFTVREVDVIAKLALGHTNANIAAALNLSSTTVSHHIERMLTKSGAASRTELVARSIVWGIVRKDVWPPAPTGRLCVPW